MISVIGRTTITKVKVILTVILITVVIEKKVYMHERISKTLI